MGLFFRHLPLAAALLLGAASLAVAQGFLPNPDTRLTGATRTPPPVADLPAAPRIPGAGNTSLPGIDPRQCGPTPHSALCAAGRWTHFSNLDVRLATSGFTASYTMEIALNNEIHVTYRETAGERTRGGEIVLVGMDGYAFRTREKFPDTAPIIDIMTSAPIMAAELVALLLDQGVIGPPSDVTAARTIRADSATQFLRASAPNTATLYGPPWRLTGTVRPGPNKHDVAFALKLAYRPVDPKGKLVTGKTDTLELTGTINFAPRREKLPDSFDLTGYTARRGEADIGAHATVGEARKAIGP